VTLLLMAMLKTLTKSLVPLLVQMLKLLLTLLRITDTLPIASKPEEIPLVPITLMDGSVW